MNTKQQLIIDKLDLHWPLIKAIQESYKNNFGRYFQGLGSSDILPDGETYYDVDMFKKPQDQKHNYYDFWRGVIKGDVDENGESQEEYQYNEEVLESVAQLTTRIFFNVWEGTEGHGWEIKLEYEDNDGRFEFHRDFNDVEIPWSLVEPIEEI